MTLNFYLPIEFRNELLQFCTVRLAHFQFGIRRTTTPG